MPAPCDVFAVVTVDQDIEDRIVQGTLLKGTWDETSVFCARANFNMAFGLRI